METSSTLKAFLRSSPAAAMSIIGLCAAMLFNFGYFYQVGLQFMSIFTLQEHIVFALSGVAVAMLLVFVLTSAYNLFIFRSDLIKSIKGLSDKKRRILNIVIELIFALAVGNLLWRYGAKYYDRGGLDLLSPLAIWILCVVGVAALAWKRRKDIDSIVYGAILFLLSSFILTSGYLYGALVVFDRDVKKGRVAILEDGRSGSIVRLGSEFSLLMIDSDTIIAVKTERFKQISANIHSPAF